MKFLGGRTLEDPTCDEILQDMCDEAGVIPNFNGQIELGSYLKAGYPIIFVRTSEDQRAVKFIRSTIAGIESMSGITYGEWRINTGLIISENSGEIDTTADAVVKDLGQSLQYVSKQFDSLFCFHNLRQLVNNPMFIQLLKDTAYKIKSQNTNIILIGVDIDIPAELQSLITIYDLDPPNKEFFKTTFKALYGEHNKLFTEKPSDRLIDIVAGFSVGMTELQAENAFALSLVSEQRLNPAIVQVEKEQAVKRGDVLEFVHTDDRMNSLGGFGVLKDWITKRKGAFTPEAAEYGLKFPKGVLLVGVPGCGKSLSARCISTHLGLPLLKFDVGKVFTSLVGSSESRVRSALKTAEAIAPVVLWIEEIEKSMAGSQSSGSTDSGTTARVMSTILTWMQENKKPIFVVATANNVESLPPELLRKGRFSEIFGVIEPNNEEREEIWRIHIGKVRPNRIDEFDYDLLVSKSKEFTGAEIEGVVEEAMFDAYADNRREMNTADLLNTLSSIVPQAIMSKEKIDRIRSWMKSRARFVSYKESETEPTGAQKDCRSIRNIKSGTKVKRVAKTRTK